MADTDLQMQLKPIPRGNDCDDRQHKKIGAHCSTQKQQPPNCGKINNNIIRVDKNTGIVHYTRLMSLFPPDRLNFLTEAYLFQIDQNTHLLVSIHVSFRLRSQNTQKQPGSQSSILKSHILPTNNDAGFFSKSGNRLINPTLPWCLINQGKQAPMRASVNFFSLEIFQTDWNSFRSQSSPLVPLWTSVKRFPEARKRVNATRQVCGNKAHHA